MKSTTNIEFLRCLCDDVRSVVPASLLLFISDYFRDGRIHCEILDGENSGHHNSISRYSIIFAGVLFFGV